MLDLHTNIRIVFGDTYGVLPSLAAVAFSYAWLLIEALRFDRGLKLRAPIALVRDAILLLSTLAMLHGRAFLLDPYRKRLHAFSVDVDLLLHISLGVHLLLCIILLVHT